ncbi:MAG: hypothetical protein LBP81_01895 [Treponema sp.]|nr:hypothetical protein [Treponema sp.]
MRDGIIYGDTDNAAGGTTTDNTAISGDGHAVYVDGGTKRNSTEASGVKLYASYVDNTWVLNDTSSGGMGDTTANWE